MKIKVFEECIDRLFPVRKTKSIENFDYPDYGNLPKKLSNTFSPEAVDAIQNTKKELSVAKSRKEFSTIWYEEMKRLGEDLDFKIN